MPKLPATPTPLATDAEMLEPLVFGYEAVTGEPITPERLAFAWAHCCLENAHGAQFIQYNWGNVTVLPSYAGDYYELTTDERIVKHEADTSKDVWTPKTLRYRANASHDAGAEFYWSRILGRFNAYRSFVSYDGDTHVGTLMNFVDEGNLRHAAWHLSASNYFTARPGPYGDTLQSLGAVFQRRFP